MVFIREFQILYYSNVFRHFKYTVQHAPLEYTALKIWALPYMHVHIAQWLITSKEV